uniref:pseudaminic acid cytidylyltransferase n=1 Tax=Algoriphagus sp. TaxID=1872435 RepID=UPI0040470EB4
MKNIAIIPARGGSKRIPRKNILNFYGKPIIAYSIEVAIKSKLFSEVMVSTDDIEIANVAKEYGAKVPFYRSDSNSGDYSTTYDVIEEVISKYSEIGKKFDNTCCIYPCAPFISIKNLSKAYNMLLEHKFNSVFPVVPYSTAIQRAFILENNKLKTINSEFENSRSQDLPKTYYDAAQFYWINNKKNNDSKKIYTNNSGCIILDELHAQDIDNNIDWELAQLKYKLINKNEN